MPIGSSFQALGLVLQKKSHDKERQKVAQALLDDPESTLGERNCCIRKGILKLNVIGL
jgi:hypothetical protein